MPTRRALARLCLAGAMLLFAAPWLMSCGDEEGPPAEDRSSDTAARAREVHASFHVPDPERIPSALATNPGTPWGNYVGSEACKRCHEEDYAKWRNSFHSRTLYDATGDTIFGDFTGAIVFEDPEYEWVVKPHSKIDAETGKRRFFMDVRLRTVYEGGSGDKHKADTYGMSIPDTGELGRTFEVLFAFGNRRHQPYVVKDKDGAHWVAPVYWNDEYKKWSYDGWRPYVQSCASCHVTGIKTAKEPWYQGQPPMPTTQPHVFNLPPAEEQWAEGAVGCETCHGPGLDHIRAVEKVGVKKYAEMIAAGDKSATIYDGKKASFDHRLDACGQCHNFNTESPCTWVPEPTGFRRDPLFNPLRPARTGVPHHLRKSTRFYADGSHMNPCTVITVYKTSAMYDAQVGCGECHDPHGTEHWADLILPTTNNELCIRCHEEFASPEAQSAHSRHPVGGPGNRCIECHMARTMAFTNGVEMMSRHVHNHYFSSPTGVRRPGGPPSACNICHDDRSHKWTREILATWKKEAAEKAKKAAAEGK